MLENALIHFVAMMCCVFLLYVLIQIPQSFHTPDVWVIWYQYLFLFMKWF